MKLNKLTIIFAAGMLIHSFGLGAFEIWRQHLQKKTEDIRKKKLNEKCEWMGKKHPGCKSCCQQGLICCVKNDGKYHILCRSQEEGCPPYHGPVT